MDAGSLRLLTLIHRVRCVGDEQREVPRTEAVRQCWEEGERALYSQEGGLSSR